MSTEQETPTTTPLPRTADQIAERMKAVERRDTFGIERSRLLECLPWSLAKDHMEDDAPWDEASWERQRMTTVEQARESAMGYLQFGWVKANHRRGVSAIKSIAHFRGLTWLMGEAGATVLAFLEDDDKYDYFGKPQLVAVSELLGFAWREHDDDEWVSMNGDEPMTATDAMAGR